MSAIAKPLFGVGSGRYQDGADNVSELFVGRDTHGASDRLYDVYGTLPLFEERDGAKRWRIGAFSEYADVDDAVRS